MPKDRWRSWCRACCRRVGYHQPPVYYLPRFSLKDDWGTHAEVGGRFRLKDETLKDTGVWSWQENPFIGTRPYQGLLVLLMMFNSTDLKNSNNTLYERRDGDLVEQWYVVRDIGAPWATPIASRRARATRTPSSGSRSSSASTTATSSSPTRLVRKLVGGSHHAG